MYSREDISSKVHTRATVLLWKMVNIDMMKECNERTSLAGYPQMRVKYENGSLR